MGPLYRLVSAYIILFGTETLADNNIVNDPAPVRRTITPVTFFHNGVEYLFYARPLSWPLAKLDCEKRNQSLARLSRHETARFVVEFLSDVATDGEDTWIGAKLDRTDNEWKWDRDDGLIPGNTLEDDSFPMESYPYWAERPEYFVKKDGDHCVAIHRRSSVMPLFVVLPCQLQRSYICEKHEPEEIYPKLEVSDMMNRTKYFIYVAKLTWNEAVAFCRTANQKIAVITDLVVLRRLAEKMRRLRPVMDHAWIGAVFSDLHNTWEWITTGNILEPKTEPSKDYPPWLPYSARNSGCLVVDRHLASKPVFRAARCKNRRGVICQTADRDESANQQQEVQGVGRTVVVEEAATWRDAQATCARKSKYGRGRLLTLNDVTGTPEFVNTLTHALADSNSAAVHAWLGGLYDASKRQWYWVDDPEVGARTYFDHVTFSLGNAKFCTDEPGMENKPDSPCLNVDIVNHNSLVLYGLACNYSQAFVCYYPPGADSLTD